MISLEEIKRKPGDLKREAMVKWMNEYFPQFNAVQGLGKVKFWLENSVIADYFIPEVPLEVHIENIEDKNTQDNIILFLQMIIDFLELPEINDNLDELFDNDEGHTIRRAMRKVITGKNLTEIGGPENSSEMNNALYNKRKVNALSKASMAVVMLQEVLTEYSLDNNREYYFSDQAVKYLKKIQLETKIMPTIDKYNLSVDLDKKEKNYNKSISMIVRVLGLTLSFLEELNDQKQQHSQ